ncbi:hypothetical protein [Vallitalea sp.]|uniref:hypothetical protein n=1 Tax=Vallitalea sp. TaxID=1882829 RepID=UPI0025E358E5|nr:hypothetical protein [Vallitalea sp.]MCT4687405.1 hypothetical protein [Vallitalea sp.]
MRINYNKQINKRIDISKISKVNNRDFNKGQTLKGEILDIKQKNIIIKLASGAELTAKLTDQMEFNIGQKVLFQVKESNLEQVLLKPLLDEGFSPKSNKLNQILEEAGVPINEKNTEIVEKLLNNNMPVDKEFINKILTLSRQFKDTSPYKLILLVKNNIPVTSENINQLDNYSNNNNSIKQEIISLANQIIDNKGLDINIKHRLINILMNNESDNFSNDKVNNVIENNNSREQELTVANSVAKENTNNEVDFRLGDILSRERIEELKKELDNTYLLKDNNTLNLSKDLSLQKLLGDIFSLEIGVKDKEILSNIITNKLLKSSVDKNIFLDRGALENPKFINDYFNDVYEKIISIIKLTQGLTEGKQSSISKDATKVKNNIEFINNLNNNFNYVQLPFKFGNKLLNSELYIFENKKELRKRSNANAISALLRLDYVNLGHIDVYINKQVNNVECKFYVEDKEKKKIIDDYIINLHKRLRSFDINVTGLIVINNKKDFNFVEDFLQRKNNSNSVKRYSFDMRV